MGSKITAENALQRWGPLWEILGFSQLQCCSPHVVEGNISTNRRADCYDNSYAGEFVERVFISTHHNKSARTWIRPKEADVLSDLLLGTSLTQQETNT